jgi:hypothetical protein
MKHRMQLFSAFRPQKASSLLCSQRRRMADPSAPETEIPFVYQARDGDFDLASRLAEFKVIAERTIEGYAARHAQGT